MQFINRLKSAAARREELRKQRAKQRGQGMTEYIIIVALIAVAAIAVYQFFGATVRNQTAAIAQEIAGNDGTQARTAASTAAGKAESTAVVKRDLSDYTNNVGRGQ